jgi:hypothetical protein
VPLRASVDLTLASQDVQFESAKNPSASVDRDLAAEPAVVPAGGGPSSVANALGDPRTARAIGAANGSASLRFGADAGLAIGAGGRWARPHSPPAPRRNRHRAASGIGGGIGIGGGAGIGGGIGVSGGAGIGIGAARVPASAVRRRAFAGLPGAGGSVSMPGAQALFASRRDDGLAGSGASSDSGGRRRRRPAPASARMWGRKQTWTR